MILLFGVVHVLCRQQCQSVPPSRRAPCGQNWDHEDRCLAKTCCYDPNDKVNPCYYPGGGRPSRSGTCTSSKPRTLMLDSPTPALAS